MFGVNINSDRAYIHLRRFLAHLKTDPEGSPFLGPENSLPFMIYVREGYLSGKGNWKFPKQAFKELFVSWHQIYPHTRATYYSKAKEAILKRRKETSSLLSEGMKVLGEESSNEELNTIY